MTLDVTAFLKIVLSLSVFSLPLIRLSMYMHISSSFYQHIRYWKATCPGGMRTLTGIAQTSVQFAVAIVYMVCHSVVILFQFVTLTVVSER